MFTFRFGGLDGVSLEAAKIADIIRHAGHDVAWFGGRLDPEFAPGSTSAAADFTTAENAALQARLFASSEDDPQARRLIDDRAAALRAEIENFIADHRIDVLMVHNVLSLPLHVPLAVALCDVLEAGDVRAIGHHHDWWFERDSFTPTIVTDLIDRCFPFRAIEHLVINTSAQTQLTRRFQLDATYLPNVMDFETGPVPGDAMRFRANAGLSADDTVLLQPTRVIRRKGIETTVALASKLSGESTKVVVTHAADRDMSYWGTLEAMASAENVDLRFVPVTSGSALADAYAAADLVCYPSLIEGFGNALLEAFFYRRPTLVNRYPVYATDIAPLGTQCIEIEAGELDTVAVGTAARWIADPTAWATAVNANFNVGRQHFSYRVVRERLLPLLAA